MSALPELVLVGAGHSHVQVLRMQRSEPLPARITLVVDRPEAVYSGMVPGVVAGQYHRDEAVIDARPLARSAGVEVVHARCVGIDAERKQVLVEGRPPLAYEVCSLNVGSTVAGTELPGVREHAVPARPIGRFIDRVERLVALGAEHVVVVGAGAGGVELAFCLQVRMGCRVTLIGKLLSARPRLAERVRAEAVDRGITLEAGRVSEVRSEGVVLDGEFLACDATVWVAGAAGPGIFEGLACDPRGFVLADDTLQVAPGLFAAGDCVHLRDHDLPKAGVYAVRQGPALRNNLRRALTGQALVPYEPQATVLTLLNLGDGTALGAKWGQDIAGAWVWRLKDRIDRVFMGRFQVLDASGAARDLFLEGMPPMAEVEMVCGGCAAKVGETDLSRALARLPRRDDSDVVMGLEAADDAAALQRPGEVMVQSVDVFPAFTDDAFLVGQVAAVNALSDLWASGVRPRAALAIVSVPEDRPHEELLFQVLSGVREHLDREGCTLLGGHTTVGEKLTVGLSVTGFAPSPDALWRNGSVQLGDALVLSRALGTGVLWHADMAGRARGPWMDASIRRMIRGNGPASRGLSGLDVSAVTDVTGFGLAGHLGEMLKAEGVSARIDVAALPVLPGVAELLAAGERSTFHEQNRAIVRAVEVVGKAGWHPHFEALFDPQTAGGLLVATKDPGAVIEALVAAGDTDAVVIGHATAVEVGLFVVR